MLWKQLLTLGCVVGILACGACFGPGYKPPPPRPLPNVKTIQIVVTNTSKSQHVPPFALAQAIAGPIRKKMQLVPELGPTSQNAPVPDAVLQLQVTDEDASFNAGAKARDKSIWIFNLSLKASLVRSDGKVLWRQDRWKEMLVLTGPASHNQADQLPPEISANALRELGQWIVSRIMRSD